MDVATRADKKLETWRGIRAAALRLFEERGYAETTVTQIAQAAGVSRGTFFNYFTGKEAVVFDPDPSDRDHWRATMEEHTEDPLWPALTAITLDFVEMLRDRMVLQRRLKRADPDLLRFAQAFGNLFRHDLDEWVRDRQDVDWERGVDGALYVNLAFACATTAYEAWRWDESFEDLLSRLRHCLGTATPAEASRGAVTRGLVGCAGMGRRQSGPELGA
ncbi:TetR/AcrR family transcriptional regulator [Kocuria sp.]|uniref:TetR/AcrR family transcriptional regulator n=1 Tax=Kocuria sp. TaxID=1871328 RepID=UPI0026DACC16|nr:TetR/AcrR family transcriptional regulator [Kocuria sp.]MDO4918990.1 helix-turn-helix domain-containing protein [Kocuria sp.]